MNIRLSPESVRMRISQEEASVLERERHLSQRIPLPEEGMSLDVSLRDDLAEPARFCLKGLHVEVVLNRQDFRAVVAGKASKDSGIRIPIGCFGDAPLEFVFEIDAFSRKSKKEAEN